SVRGSTPTSGRFCTACGPVPRRRSKYWFSTGPTRWEASRWKGRCSVPTIVLEGTNLSEGRGTTTPFEVVGAPYVDPELLAEKLNGRSLPGLRFRPVRFRPTFDKWQGAECGGVQIHVIDANALRPY